MCVCWSVDWIERETALLAALEIATTLRYVATLASVLHTHVTVLRRWKILKNQKNINAIF